MTNYCAGDLVFVRWRNEAGIVLRCDGTFSPDCSIYSIYLLSSEKIKQYLTSAFYEIK
jgi:hypothetical protein